MTKQLFIRDKEAVETALYKSYAEFSIKYESFDTTHDLKQIYDNIRKDACSKDKTLRDKIYKDDKQEQLVKHEESPKKTDTKTKKVNADEQFLIDEIKKIFQTDYKKKQGTPTNTFTILSERFADKEFDKKLVQKIHYKFRDGKLEY